MGGSRMVAAVAAAAAPEGPPRWSWTRLESSNPSNRFSWAPSSLARPIVDESSLTIATRRGLYVLHPNSRWWRWTPRGSVCDSSGGDWARVPTFTADGGVAPPAVKNAAAAVDAAGGRLWVFGGVEDYSSRPTAALYEYDEGSGRWTWLGGVADAERTGPLRGSGVYTCYDSPPGATGGTATGGGDPCAMTFSPEYPPTGLAFYHDPAEDALFVAGVVEATSPGLNPWGAPEDGRDVRVWRYDLAARTWAVVVEYSSVAPGGPPPVHDFWGTMTAFPAGNRLHLVRDNATDVSLWRYNGGGTTQGSGGDGDGGGGGGGGWEVVVGTGAVDVDATRHATWTAGRFWLAYLPGLKSSVGPGSSRGLDTVAGLTWRSRPTDLSDTDRLIAWDADRPALRGAERRGVLGERMELTGPQAVPGGRRDPQTGGRLVTGAPGCGGLQVGYLIGGDFEVTGPTVPRDDLWRITFEGGLASVFDADSPGNAPATPLPSPSPSQSPLPSLSPSPTPVVASPSPTASPVAASPSPTASPTALPTLSPSPSAAAGGRLGAPYEPCGGRSHPGAPPCAPGLVCAPVNDWYAQCRPAAVAAGEAPPWAQCGGRGWAAPPAWTAPVRCSGGYACTRLSEWYSHCAPCHSGGDDSGDTPLYA